jgi:hypothetical protein
VELDGRGVGSESAGLELRRTLISTSAEWHLRLSRRRVDHQRQRHSPGLLCRYHVGWTYAVGNGGDGILIEHGANARILGLDTRWSSAEMQEMGSWLWERLLSLPELTSASILRG